VLKQLSSKLQKHKVIVTHAEKGKMIGIFNNVTYHQKSILSSEKPSLSSCPKSQLISTRNRFNKLFNKTTFKKLYLELNTCYKLIPLYHNSKRLSKSIKKISPFDLL
jgi:hypothetical protein